MSDPAHGEPLAAYRTIRGELETYNPVFLARPELVVLTKCDIPEVKQQLDAARRDFEKIGRSVVTVSAAGRTGLESLLREAAKLL